MRARATRCNTTVLQQNNYVATHRSPLVLALATHHRRAMPHAATRHLTAPAARGLEIGRLHIAGDNLPPVADRSDRPKSVAKLTGAFEECTQKLRCTFGLAQTCDAAGALRRRLVLALRGSLAAGALRRRLVEAFPFVRLPEASPPPPLPSFEGLSPSLSTAAPLLAPSASPGAVPLALQRAPGKACANELQTHTSEHKGGQPEQVRKPKSRQQALTINIKVASV